MAINVTGADAYFAEDKHLLYAYWKRYSQKQKQAAVLLGTNVVRNALCRITWDDSATVEGDFPRYDAAVYEQAVFALKCCDILPDSASPVPSELFPDEVRGKDGRIIGGTPHKLCPAAVAMIMRNPTRVAVTR